MLCFAIGKLGGVIISMLVSRAVDCGSSHGQVITKYNKIVTCCFSKHVALKSERNYLVGSESG